MGGGGGRGEGRKGRRRGTDLGFVEKLDWDADCGRHGGRVCGWLVVVVVVDIRFGVGVSCWM